MFFRFIPFPIHRSAISCLLKAASQISFAEKCQFGCKQDFSCTAKLSNDLADLQPSREEGFRTLADWTQEHSAAGGEHE